MGQRAPSKVQLFEVEKLLILKGGILKKGAEEAERVRKREEKRC
jgi:hypothetical protein